MSQTSRKITFTLDHSYAFTFFTFFLFILPDLASCPSLPILGLLIFIPASLFLSLGPACQIQVSILDAEHCWGKITQLCVPASKSMWAISIIHQSVPCSSQQRCQMISLNYFLTPIPQLVHQQTTSAFYCPISLSCSHHQFLHGFTFNHPSSPYFPTWFIPGQSLLCSRSISSCSFRILLHSVCPSLS